MLAADKLPALAMLDQPFLFNFDALINAAFAPGGDLRAVIDKTLLETMGVRVLWWQPIGNQIVFSKGQDVASPRQIKGKRVRAISETNAKFVKLCGGEPVNMSVAQMNEAMKDGKIDMAMSGIAAVLSRDMWKVSDTVTRTDHSPLEYLLITTEKSWQALAPAHRTAIMDVVKRLEPKVRERAAERERSLYVTAPEKGMKIVDLTPHQVAEWHACSSDLLVRYMETSADVGSRLMASYGKLRTAPCCSGGRLPATGVRPAVGLRGATGFSELPFLLGGAPSCGALLIGTLSACVRGLEQLHVRFARVWHRLRERLGDD